MNLGHISFHFCPLCQNCYTIVFFIYVVRCDMPCTRIMLGFTLYNFDNKYPFIVIVIVIHQLMGPSLFSFIILIVFFLG